jgi:hypothetical protein
MIGQTIDVLIYSFIVALLPHGRDDLFTFVFTFLPLEHRCVSYGSFTFFVFRLFQSLTFFLLLYL